MAEKKYFVKKGWLIAKDAFGNMLPFFLHVRDKDIVWQNNHEEFLTNIMKNKEVSNIIEVTPKITLNFRSGRWDVDVNTTTKTCALRTCIDFTADSFDLNSSRDDLSARLNIPITLKDNYKLNIQCSLGSEASQLSLSTTTASKIYDEDELIHNIAVHVRNQVYKFPVNYYENDDYKFSSVYVTVTGEYVE